MEYTVKDKQAHEVVKGDIIWHEQEYREVSKTELSKTDISGIVIEFVTGGIHAIQVNKWHTKFICRVPSSPVMSFEEFKFKHGKCLDGKTELGSTYLKYKYEGYLIGTRSIVPELSDEQINVMALEDEDNTKFSERLFYSHGAKAYRNWLRSQINK